MAKIMKKAQKHAIPAKAKASAKIVARAKLANGAAKLAKTAKAKTANAPALTLVPTAPAPAPEAKAVWDRARNLDSKQQFRDQAQFRGKGSFRRGRFSGFGGRRAG